MLLLSLRMQQSGRRFDGVFFAAIHASTNPHRGAILAIEAAFLFGLVLAA